MNLLILHPHDFIADNRVRIADERLPHIRKVLKITPGQSLEVGILNGPMGRGELIQREENADIFQVSCKESPPAPLELSLILALPRPKVFRRVLQAVTSLGVKEIVFLHAFRVEKSYWQSPFLSETAMRAQCLEGLQQAKDTLPPRIRLEPRFRPFVEDRLPEMLRHRAGYLAHPYASASLSPAPSLPAVLAVGPEGGFIPFELDLLAGAGMQPFSLGRRILRVETAVSVLISRFMA